MTQDEIIEMACQTFCGLIKQEERANFIAFAKLVAAKEREACAKVVEDSLWFTRLVVAKAIRARGET
jgi:hypothetical protein